MAKDDNIFLKLLKTLAILALTLFVTIPFGLMGGAMMVGGAAGAATGAGIAPGIGFMAIGALFLGIAGACLKASTAVMKDVFNMDEPSQAAKPAYGH